MKKYNYLLLLLLSTTLLHAQEFSNRAIKLGIGLADLDAQAGKGFGWHASIGFQKNFWKNRVRICPNISFGTLTTFAYTDYYDAYYNNRGIQMDGYLNILRIKSVSVFIGGGLFAKQLAGLAETGLPGVSLYVKKWHAGWSAMGGIRLAPNKWRMAIEFIPLAYYNGLGLKYELFTSHFQFDIKLNKKKESKL